MNLLIGWIVLLILFITFLMYRGLKITGKYFTAVDRCRQIASKYNELIDSYNDLVDAYNDLSVEPVVASRTETVGGYSVTETFAPPSAETTSGSQVQIHGLADIEFSGEILETVGGGEVPPPMDGDATDA